MANIDYVVIRFTSTQRRDKCNFFFLYMVYAGVLAEMFESANRFHRSVMEQLRGVRYLACEFNRNDEREKYVQTLPEEI